MSTSNETEEKKESILNYLPSVRSLITGILMCGLFVLLLGVWMQSSDNDIGASFVERFGIAGLFVGIFLIDSIPTPGGGIPFMALSLKGGISPLMVVATCFSATLCAGMMGYFIGNTLGIPAFLERWFHKKFPGKLEAIQKKGVWGVLALATLPIPISLAAWAGGSFRVPLRSVLLALLIRIPKIILYLLTIQGGFSLL